MPKVEFTIRPSVTRSVDLTKLQSALQQLGTFFRQQVTRIVPTSIEQPPQAEFVIRLASKLTEVSAAPEFSRHLRSYLEGVGPAFFVTCLAAYLQGCGAAIEFEPLARKGRRADLAAVINDMKTVFECKSPGSPLTDISPSHEEIFNTLYPYIDTPHTITLRYRTQLSSGDLTGLGESIQRRLPSVREDGVFLTIEGVEVSLDTTMSLAPSGLSLMVVATAPDPEDNTVLPGLIVMRGGKKMAIYGPKVDVSEVLIGRLRKASKQAPLDAPFVAAIWARALLGSPREHRLAILEQFQPTKFTRISAGLIADFPMTPGGVEEPQTCLITNPYAVRPVPDGLRLMFGGP